MGSGPEIGGKKGEERSPAPPTSRGGEWRRSEGARMVMMLRSSWTPTQLHPTLHLHLHTTLSSWNLLSWGNLSLVANSLLVPARGRTEFLTVTGCHMVTMVTAGRTPGH